MRKSFQARSWAVYQVTVLGLPGPHVVCTQREWEDLDRANPDVYRLIKDGITNEGEAERLARGSSGEIKPRVSHKKAALVLIDEGEEAILVSVDDAGGEGPAGDGDAPVILPFTDVPEIVKELAVFNDPADELEQMA